MQKPVLMRDWNKMQTGPHLRPSSRLCKTAQMVRRQLLTGGSCIKQLFKALVDLSTNPLSCVPQAVDGERPAASK